MDSDTRSARDSPASGLRLSRRTADSCSLRSYRVRETAKHTRSVCLFSSVLFQTTPRGTARARASCTHGAVTVSGERPTIARTPRSYLPRPYPYTRVRQGTATRAKTIRQARASWPVSDAQSVHEPSGVRRKQFRGVLKRPSARRGPGIVSVDRNVRSKCRCSCVLQFTS